VDERLDWRTRYAKIRIFRETVGLVGRNSWPGLMLTVIPDGFIAG